MSSVLTGRWFSIKQISELLPPGRSGKPPSFSCIFRWIFQGIKQPDGTRVRLSAFKLGGRLVVSEESLQQFMEALMPRDATDAQPAPTPAARKRASGTASKKLKAMGI